MNVQFYTIPVNNYLLKNIPEVFGKIPQHTGETLANNVISLKKHGETLGKCHHPEPNRSWKVSKQFYSAVIGSDPSVVPKK